MQGKRNIFKPTKTKKVENGKLSELIFFLSRIIINDLLSL